MHYGFNIPARGPLANTDSILALAKRGEELGFRHLAVPDHIVIPRDIDSRYPYSQSGSFPGGNAGETLDQLCILSFLAAATSQARLLSSVMVVPHRSPVMTAKMLTTIDRLSGGRVIVGCGAGWMQEEFVAINAPPFAERGKVTDEYLQIFKILWTEDEPVFDGDYARFSNIAFLPKPIQRPHPPLWIGGESPAAMRRAARFGDAWYPIGANPRFPLNTPQRFAAGVKRLQAQAEKIDRDPASITLAYWANWYREGNTVSLDDGQRHIFTGGYEDIIEDIGKLRELGVAHLLFNFQRDTLQASLESMHGFAEQVLGKA